MSIDQPDPGESGETPDLLGFNDRAAGGYRDFAPDPVVWDPTGDRPPGWECTHPAELNKGGVCGHANCLRTLTVEIDYKVTVHVRASLTLDQARGMFGLGGTSDDDLLRRVELVAKDMGGVGNLPAGLDQHATDVGTYRREFLNMPGAAYMHEIDSL